MRDVSVVHGDLKAGNALLTRGKSVRICDFGMSEAKNRSKTMTSSANNTGKTALTVAWSAPELFEDDPKSFSTDVYALGTLCGRFMSDACPSETRRRLLW